MSCEHLVCARCSGPVSEGRCSLCRGSREQMHAQYGTSATALILALMVVLATLGVLAERFSG